MLGSSNKYTSDWFTLPRSTQRERFICRYPTTAERDAFTEAVEAARDAKGNVAGRGFTKAAIAAVLPLVEGYEAEGVDIVPFNWREVLPEATEYFNVLVTIGGEIFSGASFASGEGADANP